MKAKALFTPVFVLITILPLFCIPAFSLCEGNLDCNTVVDGSDLSIFANSFGDEGCSACCGNVVLVAKSGGDHSSIQAAIDSISDAAANNPYLVQVAPGEYSEMVTMAPYIHLQGAGQEVTIITSTAGNDGLLPTQATLELASDVSLRDLSVCNSGTGTRNAALMASEGVTGTLVTDVTVRTDGTGENNYAIFLSDSDTDIKLQHTTATAENASDTNIGLYNNGAVATLRGGTYTGRGGDYAYGILNFAAGSTLDAESITVLAEDGITSNIGLYNASSSVASLRGGLYTGRGGANTYGIYNSNANTILEAESVTVLGENGSNYNTGLHNYNSAVARLFGGSYIGRGGSISSRALYNAVNGILEAKNIAAMAENDSVAYGLYSGGGTTDITQSVVKGTPMSVYRSGGTVTISNSRLIGGPTSSTVNCVLVTRGTAISTDGSTCP